MSNELTIAHEGIRTKKDSVFDKIQVRLKPENFQLLKSIKNRLRPHMKATPANTLIMRRALEVYSQRLNALVFEDEWKAEAARVRALR